VSVTDVASAWAARGLAQGLRWLTGPSLSVLIFHRVRPQPDALFPIEIDAARFDRLMAAVARAYEVQPLAQAAQSLRQGQVTGKLRGRPLAITFDDGYADNEEIALPILRRHGLSATFYVSTGFLDGGRMWNDTIIECLRGTQRKTLDLAALGLGVLECDSLAQRRQAISRVIGVLKYRDLQQREEALALLLDVAGRPQLPTNLMLRREQVLSLHRAGMEIGAHTVNHPILTSLSDAQARSELAEGRDELQQITEAPVRTLAYPNGGPDRDYDARHVAMARELGFEAAVTTATGVSRLGDDLFELPRFTPWETALPRWLLSLAMNQKTTGFKRASPLTVPRPTGA